MAWRIDGRPRAGSHEARGCSTCPRTRSRRCPAGGGEPIPRRPLRRQVLGVRPATILETLYMAGQSPCGGFSRRRLLAGISALTALEGVRLVSAAQHQAAAEPAGIREKLGIPGPYPGRVIEVRN